MLVTLTLLLCIGAGTVGGVFFAFSTFVMKAFSQLPAAQGVAAMQRINVVVINPFFLGAFVGTAALSAACIAVSFMPWTSPRSALALSASLLYLVGTFLVTIAFNVPRNERLARMDAASADAAAWWAEYVREWTWWNHVRTVAALAAAACAALALIY